jgi:hypothetical protein
LNIPSFTISAKRVVVNVLVIEPISKIVSSFTIVALGALDVLPYP